MKGRSSERELTARRRSITVRAAGLQGAGFASLGALDSTDAKSRELGPGLANLNCGAKGGSYGTSDVVFGSGFAQN